jgi:hypothetical protein
MKNKLTYLLLVVLVSLSSCTDDFEQLNTNPYQITDESLKQNFNHIGAFFPSLLKPIIGHQTHHNLINDSYVRHFATPTPFVGGVNNTTYYIRWNDNYWNTLYNSIMAPSKQVIEIAEADGYEMFVEWANLIRVVVASRATAFYGPLIYSNYGKTPAMYDSEQELHTTFFAQLDKIVSTFSAKTSYTGFKDFDASYGGSIPHWIKLANSLRLQLAVRISKVNPTLAKQQAEKAFKDPGGLITTNADNFNISLYGSPMQEVTISFSWGDTRMSASMESILGGYDDPRAGKFWDPATDATLPADASFPYKGIRNGALLAAKGDRQSFSHVSSDFKTATERKVLDAAEVHLCLAEGVLRGWDITGTAEAHYKMGVKESFAYWGAGGADAYLANSTGLPTDYDDPKETGAVNDFTTRITNTVAWDEAASNEIKLEKIITQKWIASFTNSVESWVDHRRTGYPKLPYNYKNDSSTSPFGTVADNDFLRRHPFPNKENNNNPTGVADAITKLSNGKNEIGTRLWWDTGVESNF